MTTSLSGGVRAATPSRCPAATAVTDTATLTGTNAAQRTGTITYNVYSDAACTTAVNSGSALTITTPGTLPASAACHLGPGPTTGRPCYSGDTSHRDVHEHLWLRDRNGHRLRRRLQATTGTQLSGSGFGGGKCSWLGHIISVYAGPQ